MRRTIALPLALLAVLAMSGPAAADRQVVTDPNDTQGKLDIKRAVLSHGGSGADTVLTFRSGMFEEFRNRYLRGSRAVIVIQVKRGPESSWRIEIVKRPSGLVAHSSMCIEGQGCDFGPGDTYDVNRPTRKSVKVEIPKADLSGVGQTVRWLNNTLNAHGCNGYCKIDRAPNRGLARHEL
jgi:hypothetical protein